MASKKSKKKKPVLKARSPRSAPVLQGSHLGSIERFVAPKEKEVRVKTFIVEKPVYVPLGRKVSQSEYDEEADVKYDSRRSRYAKRKTDLDNDSLDDKSEHPEDEYVDDEKAVDEKELAEEGEEGFEEEASEGEEFSDDSAAEPLTDAEMQNVQKHVRSRGLFLNSWWKKALLWGFVEWIIVLAFVVVLQFMKLADLDPNRNWWIFLAILLSLNLIYQKFLAGKVSI
jgi:hypothetical protein